MGYSVERPRLDGERCARENEGAVCCVCEAGFRKCVTAATTKNSEMKKMWVYMQLHDSVIFTLRVKMVVFEKIQKCCGHAVAQETGEVRTLLVYF